MAVTTLIIIVLGTLATLGYGPLDLDGIPMGGFLSLFDFTANSLLIPIIGILTCIFVGYIMKPETIVDELEQGGKCRIKKIYAPLIKYACPIIIAIIMVAGLIG